MSQGNEKISYEDFVIRAIARLRNPDKSKGIHTVYSGFNNAFRKYYNEDPIPITKMLADKGIIEMQPRKGGMMLYLPGEGPQALKKSENDILHDILSDE